MCEFAVLTKNLLHFAADVRSSGWARGDVGSLAGVCEMAGGGGRSEELVSVLMFVL